MSLPATVTFSRVNTWQGKLALEVECQRHAEEAVAAVLKVMNDPATRPQHRLTAAFGILDRAYGKPMERSLNLSLSDTPDSKQYQAMSTRELLTLAANRLDKSKVINAIGETAEGVTAEGAETSEAGHPGTAPGIDFETGDV